MMSKEESLDVSYVEVSASMDSWECWIEETTADLLETTLSSLLSASGFNILNTMVHHFPVQGYTAIWLLAESHLAVHTFPESSKSYLQISSCNLGKLELFKQLLVKSQELSIL
jgi:S-adenosylmethionine decarboxylase